MCSSHCLDDGLVETQVGKTPCDDEDDDGDDDGGGGFVRFFTRDFGGLAMLCTYFCRKRRKQFQ